MKNQIKFKEYAPEQQLLLPPALKQWIPEDDLANFIMEIVDCLDLTEIYRSYNNSRGGQPPYHPCLMVSLLLYGYCVGITSSRKLETATYNLVPARVISADQHPDHDTIAEFRRRHLKPLAKLFTQVLAICQKAGLVKLGHIALDGTKIRANASKHKAMSYDRMEKKATELEAEVERLLRLAEQTDSAEDDQYGQGQRGYGLPEELQFKQDRLKKIKESMAALEQEAREAAETRRQELRNQAEKLRQSGEKRRGKEPREPSDRPPDKAQRNFTDPDSRIMKDGATKSFEQCYNAQAAVDEESQIIIATHVTQAANDKQQLKPMVEKIKANLNGIKPKKLTADAGYFSEENIDCLTDENIDAYVATGRIKHSEVAPAAPRGRIPKSLTVKEKMARKLRTKKGRATYSKRKQIVEPVFGQIKEARGFRRFSLRGIELVDAEWEIVCTTHNRLKLFRSGFRAAMA